MIEYKTNNGEIEGKFKVLTCLYHLEVRYSFSQKTSKNRVWVWVFE